MKETFLSIILFIYFIFQIKSVDLDLEKIRADILANHNYHRKRHQVGNLVRKAAIENIAQEYSEHLATIDHMEDSQNEQYGENIYACRASWGICLTGEEASQIWYNEVSDYNFNNPGLSQRTQHFTQLVWKGSTQIGCGAACSPSNRCYVTCNYYPPGNYESQFANNVFPIKEPQEDDDSGDSDTDANANYNEGMSTAGKVLLSIFIIIIILLIAFAVFHFIIKKRKFKDLKIYFIKSYYTSGNFY